MIRASLKAGWIAGGIGVAVGLLTLLVSWPLGWTILVAAPVAATWRTVHVWQRMDRGSDDGNG